MRSIIVVLGAASLLAACTTRPRAASGPTFAWDTANSVVRRAPSSGRTGATGTWTGALPAADAGGRRFTLILGQRQKAELITEYDGKGTIVEKGTWFAAGSAVTLNFTERDGQAINSFLAYDLLGDRLTPTAGWDATSWGSGGPPVLLRR
ncbi:MAG: copper resistance protein NlpE [Gemmatimonadales bacterium]|jgi:hypothetical protein|nr:copper resistance protein NlpE [Gemmatimonadales bacterium]